MKEKIREKKIIVPLLLGIFDFAAANLSYGLALWMRFDFHMSSIPTNYLHGWADFAPVFGILTILVLYAFRMYRSIWRYVSYREALSSCVACLILGILHVAGTLLITARMPVSYYIMGWIIMFVVLTGSRMSYRAMRIVAHYFRGDAETIKRLMIVGAGEAGRMIIREIAVQSPKKDRVVCLVDDNTGKQGKMLEGVKVLGKISDVPRLVEEKSIDKIIIAIPSANQARRNAIIRKISGVNCEISTMPRLSEMVGCSVNLDMVRKISVEDLLGRDSVRIDNTEISALINNSVVLVTGGGGSIGSELCRQIAAFGPRQLVIFDIYENNAYEIQQEILDRFSGIDLDVIIGSVRDEQAVRRVMEQYRPELVVHAAAHKHVPLMETVPCEAIKNNVFGTYNCAKAAADFGVKRFLLISTDKAVNPTNIMGASKRVCEMLIKYMDDNSDTDFFAVRFGNVLGSNGSVVPLFRRQIAEGGPVTVTHPEITRFFMTIPEAVSLVLQAATYAKGGELFVLDMGEPVKIDDLARKLIELAGKTPDIDIKIKYTGLRPGEKLYEELMMDEEGLGKTDNNLIFIGRQNTTPGDFMDNLKALKKVSSGNSSETIELVEKMVPTYMPGRN